MAFIFRPIVHSPLRRSLAALITVMALTVILSPGSSSVTAAALIRAEAVRARFGIALGDEIRAKVPLVRRLGATGHAPRGQHRS